MEKELAVIKTGGKQYLVSENLELEIEKIAGKKGSKVEFNEVLLFIDGNRVDVGQPLVKGVKVVAEIIDQIKAEKIKVFKFKAKSRYRRTAGHRQLKTEVLIKKISSGESSK